MSENRPSESHEASADTQCKPPTDWANPRAIGSHGPTDATIASPGSQQPLRHDPLSGPLGVSSDSFSGYEILSELHRGGQGVVYQAIQKSTRRQVAVKVMKEGPFAGPSDKARFDREVQVLGQLKHPNIVAIHDSGVAAGSYYFVMDYIEGRPLDLHVAAGAISERRQSRSPKPAHFGLPIRETMKLFLRICEAVNAAHVRGIIHRDLKPGNIRVDANAEPHVLDFGLAKVAAEPGSSAMTVTGQFIGSLPWSAPEQAEGASNKVDVRTDVYALGVVLFQMLTGRFPYDVTGTMREVMDRITSQAPARPSVIRPGVDDEVETIVLKCLAKERDRRYQIAGELARDVERYLDGDPIEAKRDSAMYMLRKQLRRHRVPAFAALAVLLTLIAGFFVTLAAWRRAESQRKITEHALTQADEARAAETEQRRQVEQQRDRAVNAEEQARASAREALRAVQRAEAVNDFMMRTLREADPRRGGREITVREALDKASGEAVNAFGQQPEMEAAVRFQLGATYSSLGLLSEAKTQLEESLRTYDGEFAGDHDDYVKLYMTLGVVYHHLGRLDEAEALQRKAVAMADERLAIDDPDRFLTRHNLAVTLSERGKFQEAETLLRGVLTYRRLVKGNEGLETLTTLSALGWCLHNQKKPEEALPMYREAMERAERSHGKDHPDTITFTQNYAQALKSLGRVAEAEPLAREAVERARRVNGHDHPSTAVCIGNLAEILDERKQHGEAERLFQEALAIERKAYREGPAVVNRLKKLTKSYRDHEELKIAEPLAREAYDMSRRVLEPDHPDRLIAQSDLAWILWHNGNTAEAEPMLRDGIAAHRRVYGTDHRETLAIINSFAVALHNVERYDDAEPLYREALDIGVRALGPDHKDTIIPRYNLARLLKSRGDYTQAEAEIRAVIEQFTRTLGPQHPHTGTTISGLGDVLLAQKRFEEAVQSYRDGLAIRVEALGADHPQTRKARVSVAAGLLAWGEHLLNAPNTDESTRVKPASGLDVPPQAAPAVRAAPGQELAERILRECLDMRLQTADDVESIVTAEGALARCLVAESRWSEAESLLLSAHNRAADADRASPAVQACIRQLADLYDRWNRTDDAARWRAALPPASQPGGP